MSVLAVIYFILGVAYAQDPSLRFLGARDVRLAGFSNLYVHDDSSNPTERYSFLLSTFNPIPFTRDTTYFFHHIGKYLDDFANAPLTVVNDRFNWPREPSQTPGDVFGFESVTQPDGFLVPGKNQGSINVVDFRDYNNPVTHDIVLDDSIDYFYHRVLWKDCNGDGRKDALTLRARVVSGVSSTEMVWFEHPASNVFDGPWVKHVLNTDIADTFLAETKLTSGGVEYDVLAAVGYFTKRLTIFWTNDPNGLWVDPGQIGSRVVDVGGQFFDVYFDDLNKDGNMDLLVPINAEVNGTLVAYEIPEDFKFGQYRRHLLADGFDALSGLGGGGSPGQAKTFYPVSSMIGNTKPWILISGDDEGTSYYMKPNSESVNDWTYDRIKIIDEGPGNILGTPCAADVNGDGYAEIFVPAYNKGKVNAFTFAP